MATQSWYVEQADSYFSRYALLINDYFQDIKEDLKKADMSFTLTEYLSTALMSSTIAFIFVTPLISIFVGLALGSTSGIIAGLIAGLFIGMFLAVGIFMGFYVYPSVKVSKRRDDINHNLPFATMYLSTVAGSGTPPAAMFKLLGQFDEYGEVSKESRKIARDVYTFGADLDEALTNAAKRTPSEKFKELLWGLNSVITTGGDLKSFLQQKSDAYMDDYRRELDKFTDTLSLMVEMYITVVIVGSVFLMIISTIMSALGSSRTLVLGIQMATVVFLLPMAAIAFILIVKSTSPLE
ncbi:MAG: type II secretion system F family protein [Candidatus Nanohaloarchaea archaeon]|nr:type II secretion system F family protein [Candidatus Nanohaloarchaea archaeon]